MQISNYKQEIQVACISCGITELYCIASDDCFIFVVPQQYTEISERAMQSIFQANIDAPLVVSTTEKDLEDRWHVMSEGEWIV